MIDKPILGLLTFGSAPFWRLKAPKRHISGRTDGGAALAADLLANSRTARILFDSGPGFYAEGKAVNKLAASAASLDGFSSRDQVGC